MNDSSISFGKPESVIQSSYIDYLGMFADPVGEYYIPPILLSGLAMMSRANAHQNSCLIFRHLEIINAYVASPTLSAGDFSDMATDFLTFGNGYFQKIVDGFGQLKRLKHLPALNMRRLQDGNYGMLLSNGEIRRFAPGEVIHIKKYDPVQQIYGIPDWLGGLQGALLNEDATLFRRRYYKNGTHLGYILYTTDPKIDPTVKQKIQEAVAEGKGVGNFRSMHMHVPNGNEKGVQLLPVGDISRKDEFERVKKITAEDVVVAHRVPPQLAGVMPTNTGGFGDVTKSLEVYRQIEVVGACKTIARINAMLPSNMALKFEININENNKIEVK